MTRGKCAAAAANRRLADAEAAIKQAQAETEKLRTELGHARDELELERRERNSTILARSDRLSHKLIESARAEVIRSQQLHSEHIETLAFALLDLYSDHGCTAGNDVEGFNLSFAELFGMSDRYGEIWDYIRSLQGELYGIDGVAPADPDPDDPDDDRGRELNRYEKRFTSTAKKIRRANALAKQMANGKAARGNGTEWYGIGRATGSSRVAEIIRGKSDE